MMKITKEINKEIFRAYDIRGIADRYLTDDVIYTIARVLLLILEEWVKILV